MLEIKVEIVITWENIRQMILFVFCFVLKIYVFVNDVLDSSIIRFG